MAEVWFILVRDVPIDLIHIFMHIESVDITWDARKAHANLAAHGVSFADAEVVLTDSLGLTLEDPGYAQGI